MGNEASRSSRHSNGSSPLRRSSRRNSKSKTLNGGQQYIAEDEMDPRGTNQLDMQVATPKPVKRMEKIRRSLSFRRKKKSDKQSSKYQQQPNDSTLPTVNLTSSVSAPINIHQNNANNNNSSSSAASASVSKSNSTTTQALVNNHNCNASNTPTTINTNNNTNLNNNDSTNSPPPVVTKPPHWIEDEKRVRAGNCSFQVKYLGCTEVSDSRGMHLCELAIEKLLSEKDKKKPIKAILYVSGDSLRVVDEGNKTLLVDQTIEKVSFCAPDRHHENGFAYICRDGTTRRWLCHCFMATKDTLKNSSSANTASSGSGCSGGERLSHAVGCAFSVCLEKKQKRERENVTMEVGPNHSFTRMGSFRQASLTERLEDPQMVMPANEPVPLKQVENPHAIERPRANPDAFNRQNSLRGSALQLQFKRNSSTYASLKPGELPSFQQQKLNSGLSNSTPTTPTTTNSTTSSMPITKTSLLMQQHQMNQSMNNQSNSTPNTPVTPITPVSTTKSLLTNSESIHTKINTISELPEEQFNANESITNSTNNQSKLNELNVQTTNLTSNQPFIQTLTPSKPIQSVLPPPPPIPPHPTQIASNSQLDSWPNNNYVPQSQQQNLFYNTSILTTPTSLPVTPTPINLTTPPPLPPMPTQYTTTPITAIYQNQIPLQQQPLVAPSYIYSNQQQVFYPNQTSTVTPLVPMMQMMQIQSPLQTQIYTTPIAQPLVSSMVSPSSTNQNETFEQKWARIQAAKKTNPFAEDIAKKFEIKL